jgi:hypothetical protein
MSTYIKEEQGTMALKPLVASKLCSLIKMITFPKAPTIYDHLNMSNEATQILDRCN